MSPISGNYIILPDNRELKALLSSLSLPVEDGFLSEDDCDSAGLSFEFFQAFARLARGDRFSAEQILRVRDKKLPSEDSVPKFTKSGIEMTPRYETNPLVNTPQENISSNNVSIDTEGDMMIDGEEAKVLVAALYTLGGSERSGIEGRDEGVLDRLFSPVNRSSDVREKINELGANQCWLTPSGLRLGLFGKVNLESAQYVGMSLFGRESTSATVFECPDIASMHEYEQGLFFRPENVSPSIQQASEAIVRISDGYKDVKLGGGAGVAVLKHGYILTAGHVVGATSWNCNGSITIEHKGKEYVVNCKGVIPLGGVGSDTDLVLLYVPDMPKDIKPLSFSEAHRGDIVYAIGFPHQDVAKGDMLVASGTVEDPEKMGVEKRCWDDRTSTMTSTIVALPGNSGGAVINEEGELVGIAKSLIPDTPDGCWPVDEFQKMKINGSRFVPMAELGPLIEEAISNHEKAK